MCVTLCLGRCPSREATEAGGPRGTACLVRKELVTRLGVEPRTPEGENMLDRGDKRW
jgi:hypothetical protein